MYFPRIITIINAQKGSSKNSLTRETRFKEDLGYDSLDLVEFAMFVEDTFQVSVPDRDIAKWKTLGDVENYLHHYIRP